MSANLHEIRLFLFDVDGVMTDGSIHLDDTGRETKSFNVKDGFAIAACHKVDIQTGILTARVSRAVTHRARELKITHVTQGASNKAAGFQALLEKTGLAPHQIAYMGDDLTDLPVLAQVGWPVAPADAVDEVAQLADFVTTAPGGHGAIREAIEHLLRTTGDWQTIVDQYR